MKRLSLLFLAIYTTFTLTFAQDENSSKYSITTQMFLQEMKGELSMEIDPTIKSNEKKLGLIPVDNKRFARYNRLYANPDTINGVVYIPAFIRLDDNTKLSDLQALGVEVQCVFQKGLITANIPIEKLEKVSSISNVKRITVSPLMKPTTNKAREKTNVDDVLTNSTDAIALGVTKKYDGTGVVLGVIDTGIDFQHIAFKDKNGNSRIKRAYVYNGSSAQEYTSISSSSPTTDDNSEDHGTHTSSTAGGSSVIINGSNVTVTDDHANATYGGMAPGADLYLAGINGLSSTYIANAFQKIINYADQQGKPVVISNSWGGQYGPHDGTGDLSDVFAQYFSDNNPNHICLFAASNDAGKSKDNEGGGYHISGNASSSNPLGSILRSASYYNTDAGYYYYGPIANAWARSTSVSSMACKIYVLDSSTGAVKTSVTVTPTTNGATVSGLSSYFSGTLYAYKDYVDSNKTQILLYTSGLTSRSTSTTTKNGETYYKSNYTLAVQFYPTSGSCIIDVWGGSFGYFTNHLTTSGYTWVNGSDDMSVSDDATDPNVISVGAYVTKNSVVDYNGNTQNLSSDFPTIGDIAYFSSYATAAQSPTGLAYPWITAPGATIVSAVNHYDTSGDYSYINGNSAEYGMYRVNSNTTSPYGTMEGTSMATPVASGIVALWLQAANENNIDLTTSYVKEVMKETAIKDSYTNTGANASHFGNGKIDALAGLQYILGSTGGPAITANPKSLAFSTEPGELQTQSVNVSSFSLTDNISINLTDGNGVFSIDKTSITNEGTLNVTFMSNTEGTYTGTIILSSAGVEPVTISLSATASEGGTASDAYLNIAKYETINEAGWRTALVNNLYKYTEYPDNDVAWLTLPVYGAFVGARYATNSSTVGSGHPQAWIECDLGTSNTYGGTTWTNTPSATNPFNGSSTYFTSATARAIGYNSRSNTEIRNVYYYVTNTTAVKLSGTGRSGASSTYPASLKVYECTKNANGTLTVASTTTKNLTSSSTSTFTLTADGLDKDKIYKVETSIYRGYLYEVAFQTPIEVLKTPEIEANPAAIEFTANVGKTTTKTFTVSGTNLNGNITATLSGRTDIFSIDQNTITQSNGSANATITVSYTPTEAGGPFNGAVTLSSDGASPVTVSLTATATEPELIVDPEELNLTTSAGTSINGSFSILGDNLNGPVTLTLNDANGVFSISETSVSVGNALEGVAINVTFSPEAEGTYTATVTVSTEGLTDQTVILNGTATNGWFDLTVGKYGIATLYTDIDLVIPYEDEEDILGIYYGKEYVSDEGELRLKRLNRNIPANTGVVVQANSGTYRFPKASNDNDIEQVTNNVLSGVLVNTPVSEIEGTVLTLGKGTNGYIGFYKYTGATLRANSAFLIIPDDDIKSINTLSLVIGKDSEDATGIEYIFGKPDAGTNDQWFTLQGLRLNGKPTEKGIYIHGGKTVLVK